MAKLFFRILLIIVVLAFAAYACVDGTDGTTSKGGALKDSGGISIRGLDATATFGAEQFHLQLTAIAQPDQ
jgi:hypothetical protein